MISTRARRALRRRLPRPRVSTDDRHLVALRRSSALPSERTCRRCGCTDSNACPGGCSWVEHDLCSACASPTVLMLGALRDPVIARAVAGGFVFGSTGGIVAALLVCGGHG